MIELSRRLARRYQAVLRRALSAVDRRTPPPPVRCTAGPDGLTLVGGCGDVCVRYQEPGAGPSASMGFRADLLAAFAATTDEPVTLEQTGDTGQARWSDRGVPRTTQFDTIPPERLPPFPELPRRFLPMAEGFLPALGEAARSVAAPGGRPALARLMLRGKDGSVIATDGCQLLVQHSFRLPWSSDVLVPPLVIAGPRDGIDLQAAVGLGRTQDHVAVRVGPWTFLLAIDTHNRFPVIENVIPRPGAIRVRLQIAEEDAAALGSGLAKLPGRSEQYEPVTLDLHSPPVVRAKEGEQPVMEIVLARSTVTGPPLRLSVNRRLLQRALHLGFREFQVTDGGKPVLCRDDQRTFVFMPLDQASALPPSPEAIRAPAPEPTPAEAPQPDERRQPAMPTPDRNGHHAEPEPRSSPPTDRPTLEELITEAEQLRSLLHDAAGRSTRLVAALKQQRRRSRAVEAAVASLRQLQLGP